LPMHVSQFLELLRCQQTANFLECLKRRDASICLQRIQLPDRAFDVSGIFLLVLLIQELMHIDFGEFHVRVSFYAVFFEGDAEGPQFGCLLFREIQGFLCLEYMPDKFTRVPASMAMPFLIMPVGPAPCIR